MGTINSGERFEAFEISTDGLIEGALSSASSLALTRLATIKGNQYGSKFTTLENGVELKIPSRSEVLWGKPSYDLRFQHLDPFADRTSVESKIVGVYAIRRLSDHQPVMAVVEVNRSLNLSNRQKIGHTLAYRAGEGVYCLSDQPYRDDWLPVEVDSWLVPGTYQALEAALAITIVKHLENEVNRRQALLIKRRAQGLGSSAIRSS
ncbi:MAG TPA: hypothetical protein VGA08_01990 [Candidatus Saccharimonadales bacterium]